MTCGIYFITCSVNGRGYVGMSSNIEQRWENHRYMLNRGEHQNLHMLASWNKYGSDSFKFEILEEVLEKNLPTAEIDYIARLCPEFNMDDGGGGKTAAFFRDMWKWPGMREHIGEQVSRALNQPNVKKKHRDAVIAAWTSEKRAEHSARLNRPETKKRMSDSHRGYKMPQSQKDKIAQKVREHYAKKKLELE